MPGLQQVVLPLTGMQEQALVQQHQQQRVRNRGVDSGATLACSKRLCCAAHIKPGSELYQVIGGHLGCCPRLNRCTRTAERPRFPGAKRAVWLAIRSELGGHPRLLQHGLEFAAVEGRNSIIAPAHMLPADEHLQAHEGHAAGRQQARRGIVGREAGKTMLCMCVEAKA